MNKLWQIDINEYLEILQIAKEIGIKPGESIEQVFLAYMEIKKKKPIGNTELTKEEMINEIVSKNNKLLEVSIDKEGKQIYKIFKPKD